jgi:16S rRNA (cytidine1402-2'-O)-methyltransferase
MKKGKLYLIPSSLGSETSDHILPVFNQEITKQFSVFIVENIRTARRFLRSTGYVKDFDDVVFHLLDKHSRPEEWTEFLNETEAGKDIGLLSEAGLPCIADPGNVIVRNAHKKGIEITPLVGPSSLMLALMASGFNGQNFCFHGYLPIKSNERKNKIKELENDVYRKDQTQIFIETPYRNLALLESIIKQCKGSSMLCIAFDLTLDTQKIISKTVAQWKKTKIDLHKKPAVFLIYK